MNALTLMKPLSADEWLDREIDDLSRLRQRLAGMTTGERADAVRRFEEAAFQAATAPLDTNDPSTRLTMIWIAGRYALKAKVYGAANRNLIALPDPASPA